VLLSWPKLMALISVYLSTTQAILQSQHTRVARHRIHNTVGVVLLLVSLILKGRRRTLGIAPEVTQES
jgi:hypothetical protein